MMGEPTINQTAWAIVVICALALGSLYAMRMDMEDELKEEESYCHMVRRGYWPDFNGTYDEYCKEDKE